MLLFVIPLQSQKVSNNWKRVSELAKRTCKSVCGQLGNHWKAVLVCNESPYQSDELVPAGLSIITEDFPIPEPNKRMNDKWRKVRRGLLEAKKINATHVMVVDADDLVSNRLSEMVHNHKDEDFSGWLLSSGYTLDHKANKVYRRENLHLACGTTNIVDLRHVSVPEDMDSPTNSPIVKQGHSVVEKYYISQGRPLRRCPFRASIYVQRTGDNDSGSGDPLFSGRAQLKNWLNWRPMTSSFKKEFGI